MSCSQVRKSTLNPNANEFKPRFNTQVSMPCCCQPAHSGSSQSDVDNHVSFSLHSASPAKTSQHPDAPPASGPAKSFHRGPAAPGCLQPDSLLPPDVSHHTSQPWSAGETHICMLTCGVWRQMYLFLFSADHTASLLSSLKPTRD